MRVLLLGFIPLLFLMGCGNKNAYDPHYIMSDAAEETDISVTSEPSTSL